MKFWKYSRVALALIGSVVMGLSITCCGVYTSGYMYVTGAQFNQIGAYKIDHDFGYSDAGDRLAVCQCRRNSYAGSDHSGRTFLAVVNQGARVLQEPVAYPSIRLAAAG